MAPVLSFGTMNLPLSCDLERPPAQQWLGSDESSFDDIRNCRLPRSVSSPRCPASLPTRPFPDARWERVGPCGATGCVTEREVRAVLVRRRYRRAHLVASVVAFLYSVAANSSSTYRRKPAARALGANSTVSSQTTTS